MNRQRGYVLIQALIAIVGLVALMSMIALDEQAFSNVEQNHLRLRRADAAAQAAIARAMASISAATPSEVTLNDDWALQGANGNEEFQFADGSADYRLEIVDACSLINLNTASATQLEELPLTASQVDSLLDWIQTGESARDDGAKDDFYNSLATPYNAKLAPLTTVDELLLVQGWTPATIYQPPSATSSTASTTLTLPTDQNGNELPLAYLFTAQSMSPNTSSTGGTLLNLTTRSANTMQELENLGISRNTATEIAARTPLTSFADLATISGLSKADMTALLNGVTFSSGTTSTGKINLNTVSNTVLQTLPSVSTDMASSIVQQQSQGFTQLGDLANLSSITVPQLAEIADNFTVGSDSWIVHAYGESGGVGESVEAIVVSNNGTLSILNEERLPTGQPPAWWGWSTQTPTTQDAGVAQ